jgi:UDP-N-acetylglucosamine pyrophosphorylase
MRDTKVTEIDKEAEMSANDNDNKSISDVQAENLAKNWSILSRPEQRQRLKELVAGERSMRGLAKRIGVSEATIRKRVDLAKLAPAEREAVESGKASVKGTLREIRRQRAARGPKIPTDQEGRTKFCKERVQLTLAVDR